MSNVLLYLTAFIASLLTFFSGFGLGTILTPVMAIFFPIEIAIALTGVVHLLNNLFKGWLMGKYIDRSLLWAFGLPSLVGALVGAWVLNLLAAHNQTLYTYNIGSSSYDITLLKFLIGILIIVFVGMEQSPSSKNKQFPKTWHTIGGLISGFFGGLSGNQGALRTMFLIKSDIPKEAFLATGIAIACLVDITRLTTYFTQPERLAHVHANLNTVGFATLFAFFGAYLGSRLFHKITLASIQKVVMVSLLLIAVLLIFGII